MNIRLGLIAILTLGPSIALSAALPPQQQPSPAPKRSEAPSSQHGAPPARAGCYRDTRNGWQAIPCASEAYIRAHFPHPELEAAIKPKVATTTHARLVWGQIAVSFSVAGAESDSKYGPNAWSFQDNTNAFRGNNGDADSVQFTDQSQSGYQDLVCIWNVDTTKQVYHSTCVNAPRTRSGGIQAGDYPSVAGTVVKGSGHFLNVTAYLPWTPAPSLWATVANDEYGLASNWHEVSGTVLGLGKGSHATFQKAALYDEVEAAACYGDIPGPSAGFPNCRHKHPLESTDIAGTSGLTEETNNLVRAGSAPSVFFFAPDYAQMSALEATKGRCAKDSSTSMNPSC
jgi:hypothetical protein